MQTAQHTRDKKRAAGRRAWTLSRQPQPELQPLELSDLDAPALRALWCAVLERAVLDAAGGDAAALCWLREGLGADLLSWLDLSPEAVCGAVVRRGDVIRAQRPSRIRTR